MKNNKIGEMLKKYRKLNALSIADVVVELQDKYGVNVAEKTVYGWESNQAHPTSDVFVALCDIYRINNITDVFNSDEPKGFHITAEERQLIEHYREHPEMHTVIQKILNIDTTS
jgi:transcriptional regulator with XRE-family HTH domain